MSEEKKEPAEDNKGLDKEEVAEDKKELVEDDGRTGKKDSLPDQGKKKPNTLLPLRVSLTILTTLALAAFFVTVYAIANVQVWTVVDKEGYSYEVGTGTYRVTRGTGQLCYEGQDWTDCENLRINEYNSVCANRSISNNSVCEDYLEMIEWMESVDGPGYYVASLGSGDTLTATEETERRWVEPVTHEAYCYLGFIGECPTEEDQVD